jgi:hypothetical protein
LQASATGRAWQVRARQEIHRMLDGRVDAFARHLIHGWAADADRPDARVEVVVLVDGQFRGSVRADRPREDLQMLGTLGDGAHGFAFAFDPPLSPLRSYEIKVCHAGTDEALRVGRFTVSAEINHAAERMRPIMVSFSGQSSGIDLMRGLASDPAIVAADSHAFGVKLMSYYGRALEVLVVPSSGAPVGPTVGAPLVGVPMVGAPPVGALPAGATTVGAPMVGRGGDGDNAYALTPNPFHGPNYERLLTPPRLLYEFFQNQSAIPISAAFKAVVMQFYETLAMHQGKRMAGYFAEQCDLFDVARSFARLAFREVHEIVLLQDPREAYCGYRMLWSVTPAQAMATLRRVCDRVAELRRENRQDTLFLRCEDLRLRPEATLVQIARFLLLDRPLATDPQKLRAAAEDAMLPGVGQWRIELDSDEIALLEREFADYLELFGYDMAVPAPA